VSTCVERLVEGYNRDTTISREKGPSVKDILFLAVLVVFFALAVLFVHGCERIVGPDLEAETPAEDTEPERAAA
jgi:hypothetical protein